HGADHRGVRDRHQLRDLLPADRCGRRGGRGGRHVPGARPRQCQRVVPGAGAPGSGGGLDRSRAPPPRRQAAAVAGCPGRRGSLTPVCGIAGFVAPAGVGADRAVLERMVASLRHRGPDAVGYHVDGPAAVGVARLRVIDLETGDQPIATEDGSATVVLNGEIYDCEEHRTALAARGHRFRSRSDTEVIAHAWEESGEHVPDRLNGMFAFAVWDRDRAQLSLARAGMGEKPLYYPVADGWLVFASELRALLAHPAVTARLDLQGLARYLAYEYVPDPHSILAGVAKLPPGHLLIAAGGRIETRRYWDIPFRPEPEVDERAWCEEIARRFDRAVALRLVSDVPVGCFVSGGIDSTVVAGTAARQRAGIRTFSVGYDGTAHDERRYA